MEKKTCLSFTEYDKAKPCVWQTLPFPRPPPPKKKKEEVKVIDGQDVTLILRCFCTHIQSLRKLNL